MEKKAREIIGLPVVTFNRGSKIYEVEDLILDPERRQVLALLVMESAFFHSARAIPFGRISAIGPDAVIVPDGKAVIDVGRDPVLKRLHNNQTVRGLRVLSDDGRKIGQVADMVVDDKTGEIKGYNVSIGKVLSVTQGTKWLPAESILSMGTRVVYVPAAVADELDQQTGGWAGALEGAGGSLRTAGDRLRTAGGKANTRLEELGNRAKDATAGLNLQGRAGSYIVGRQAHSDVMAPDGTPIVSTGDTITEEHVQAARDANRMPQLMLSAGRGPAKEGASSLESTVTQSMEGIRTEARQLWGQVTGRYEGAVNQTDDRNLQRRVRHSLGRPVTRVILDADDNIILNTGDIITNRAIEAAREAGVLDILADSVYTERPRFTLDELKASRTGDAALDNITPGSAPPARRQVSAVPPPKETIVETTLRPASAAPNTVDTSGGNL